MTPEQYKQIAFALLALADTDQKANLVQILACNFTFEDVKFNPFKFVQLCYVQQACNVISLEDYLDNQMRA